MKLFFRLSRLGFFLLALSLAGCAGTPPSTQAQASAKIHTELAAQYYQRAQYGIALEELEIALQAAPRYAPAFNLRGLVHMELREFKEADADFRQSLRLEDDAEAHNNYGWFLCQRGKETDAIEHFMQALKNPLYQTPEKAYLNAGLCSRKSGKMKEAEEFLSKALRLQPSLPEALLALAELSFDKADHAAAKSYFMQFSQNNTSPLTADNLWLAVRIERKIRDKKTEESYAAQLRQRFPDARETQLLRQR